MKRTVSAGRKLRTDLDAALAAAGRGLGQSLEWDERESDIIIRAAATADRAEELRAVFTAERDDQARPGAMVKLSAELRLLDKAVVDLLARLSIGVGPAKSQRHVRAARSRWDRERA